MWGAGRKSPDTLRKLQMYDDYRKDTYKRGRMYSDTVIFEQPLHGRPLQSTHTHTPFSKNWTMDTLYGSSNKSAELKRSHYREVYGDSIDSLFDYDSYVDIATLPATQRPHSFTQCVDFFYPMSGVNSHISTQSPFVSTWPNAYDNTFGKTWHAANDGGTFTSSTRKADVYYLRESTMPVDLGELSMFYVWFFLYRFMLCPKTFQDVYLPDPANLFGETTDSFVHFSSLEKDVAQYKSKYEDTLNNVRTTFNVIGRVALASAQDDSFSAETIVNHAKRELQGILEAGITKISREIASDLGISSSMSNSIVRYFADGKFNPKSLSKIANSNDTLDVILTTVNNNVEELAQRVGVSWKSLTDTDQQILKSISIFGTDYNKIALSDLQTNTSLKSLLSTLKSQGTSRLSAEGKRVLNSISELQTKPSIKPKEAFDRLRGARSNGLIATLAVSATVSAFNAWLTYEENKLASLERAIQRFAKSRVIRLDPRFAEESVEFVIDSQFDLVSGVKHGGSDKDWYIKPYCGTVLGEPFKRYIIKAYTAIKPIIQRVRNRYNTNTLNGYNLAAALKTNEEPFRNSDHVPWEQNIAYCHPFAIFQHDNVPLTSAGKVLQYLPDFSQFTQAFGFEPTFLAKGISDQNGLNELKTRVGQMRDEYDIGVFGAAVNKGKTFGDYRNGAWTSPGNTRRFSTITSYDDSRRSASNSTTWWSTDRLQMLGDGRYYAGRKKNNTHNKTLNSQRKLNSATPYGYAGFTDLTFDVAMDVPIFNAQWAAAVSVIFCYSEALDTLAKCGYSWAVPLVAERKRNLEASEAAFRTTKSILDFARRGKSPILPVTPRYFAPQLFNVSKTFNPNLFALASKPKPKPTSEAASSDGETVVAPKPNVASDEIDKVQDTTSVALQLGITTTSLGLLAILAMKLRRIK